MNDATARIPQRRNLPVRKAATGRPVPCLLPSPPVPAPRPTSSPRPAGYQPGPVPFSPRIPGGSRRPQSARPATPSPAGSNAAAKGRQWKSDRHHILLVAIGRLRGAFSSPAGKESRLQAAQAGTSSCPRQPYPPRSPPDKAPKGGEELGPTRQKLLQAPCPHSNGPPAPTRAKARFPSDDHQKVSPGKARACST